MTFKFALIVVTSLVAFQVKAQSVAKPGHECSYEVVTPALNCLDPEDGHNIDFEVREFQTCKDGMITELDRRASSEYFDDANIKVTYAATRTHFDDRAGDLTFILPTAVVMKSASETVQLNISTQKEPNYPYASETEWHYTGTYLKSVGGKAVKTGKLICGL